MIWWQSLTLQARVALSVAVLLATAAAASWLGYSLADSAGKQRVAEVQKEHADTLRAFAKKKSEQEAAWRQQVNEAQARAEISLRQLAEREKSLQGRHQKLRQEIVRHVPSSDAACLAGFDDQWLRDYNAAYGLSADVAGTGGGSAAQGVGAAAAAVAPDAGVRGLTAKDILVHAADTGLWCQTLETRLAEVIRE